MWHLQVSLWSLLFLFLYCVFVCKYKFFEVNLTNESSLNILKQKQTKKAAFNFLCKFLHQNQQNKWLQT